MSHLLKILGRGLEVETDDLIWHWLSQAAETIGGSERAQARLLNKIIESASSKKPKVLQQRIEEYRKAYPKSHYADLAGAAAALAENRLNEANELLKTVYSRSPSNITALYALGHCCERLNREAEAIAFYQDCLKFKNYLQYPRQRLAAIHFKNGQIQKTIREYELLGNEYPDDLSTLLTLGNLYIVAGRYKDAADTFSTAILIQPDNFSPDMDPIDCLIESGDYNDALEEIDNALTEHPDRPDLLLRRAGVLVELDEHDQALDNYNHTIEIYPDFLEANILLGSHYMRVGKADYASRQFTRAVQVNDRIVGAYLGLATAQKLAGDNCESLVSLSLASAIETNGPILLAQAACLENDNKSDEIGCVLNKLRQMLEMHPQNLQLHYRFGILLMSVGRFSQAAELFTKALEINPTFLLARDKLALCLYESDERALAFEKLTLPDYLQPDTLDLHYRIALLYCDKIRFASSLRNLEQWLRETLTTTDAAINISIVLQNMGLLSQAQAECETISCAPGVA
jgi:tetratricopeptide (TPR) repeat protein